MRIKAFIRELDFVFSWAWVVILAYFIIKYPFNNPLGRYVETYENVGGHAITYIMFISVGLYIALKTKSFTRGLFGMLTLIFLHELLFNIGFLLKYGYYLFTPAYIYFVKGTLPLLAVVGYPLIFKEYRLFFKEALKHLINKPVFFAYFLLWLAIGLPISDNTFIQHVVNDNPFINMIEICYSALFLANLIPVIKAYTFFARHKKRDIPP